MTNTYYTEDLTDFGTREFSILAEILNTWGTSGLPSGFYSHGVRPAMNKSSGYVFLVNDDYQVAMMNGKHLEVYHYLPSSLKEGFLTDLMNDDDPETLDQEDQQFILANAEDAGVELNSQWRDIANRIADQN